jgi:hypothetical protein
MVRGIIPESGRNARSISENDSSHPPAPRDPSAQGRAVRTEGRCEVRVLVSDPDGFQQHHVLWPKGLAELDEVGARLDPIRVENFLGRWDATGCAPGGGGGAEAGQGVAPGGIAAAKAHVGKVPVREADLPDLAAHNSGSPCNYRSRSQ